jgi:hypothetical protein
MSGTRLPNSFDFPHLKKYESEAVLFSGGCIGVPIQRFLQRASFGPDEIRRLTQAYEGALELLGLTDRTDPLCELIAAKIIQVYRLGEHDPPRLCARTIKELGVPLPE